MQIETTPSVYFNFDDSHHKTNFTGDHLFDLSCTNQKQCEFKMHIYPSHVDLEQPLPSQPSCTPNKLKTEQFFQQFQNNFVVTFQQESKPIIEASTFHSLSRTGLQIFKMESTCSHNEHNSDDLQRIDLSFQPLVKKVSDITDFKESFRDALSLLRAEAVSSVVEKEKESPIPSFQVKKRTVFKNKANILNRGNFKITNKKIINQNTLQLFTIRPNSCQPQKSKDCNKQNIFQQHCLTSKIGVKDLDFTQKLMDRKLAVDKNYNSSIFNETKKPKDRLRSTTIDNWKRKFMLKKKSLQQKTVKRITIFSNLLVR